MPTVLVVDDSAIDRLLAGRLLEKNPGLEVRFASNGSEALEQIARELPDIVLTDLQMPVIDGLQLVETVRDRFPLVPVILMTAHGGEDVAVRALLSGAASYVPKVELPRHLLNTVNNVLEVARNHEPHRRLLEAVQSRSMHFVLDNDSKLVRALVDQVQKWLAQSRLIDDGGRLQLALALEEALMNALYRGNLELTAEELEESRCSWFESNARDLVAERAAMDPYKNRRIHVDVNMNRDEVSFTIRSDGPMNDASIAASSTNPAALMRQGDRGGVLLQTAMDVVTHSSNGREIKLVKRRRAPPSAVALG